MVIGKALEGTCRGVSCDWPCTIVLLQTWESAVAAFYRISCDFRSDFSCARHVDMLTTFRYKVFEEILTGLEDNRLFQMKITVDIHPILDPSGKLEFDVEPNIMIKQLKEMIEQRVGVPPSALGILLRGRLLDNYITLQDAGVEDGATLHTFWPRTSGPVE